MAIKATTKENLELAKEHLDIAEDLINSEAKKCDDDNQAKKLAKTQFDLERAEADMDEVEKE